ncbi:hypothetical protein D3OALGA1CA_2396 [Olavius algarvensis associated proteobacterium Delta 3]|nr:hypothetical protein D3OALGA1CA_2396 [Olavius algarvensis associated proteobacterium Delta 3]
MLPNFRALLFPREDRTLVGNGYLSLLINGQAIALFPNVPLSTAHL